MRGLAGISRSRPTPTSPTLRPGTHTGPRHRAASHPGPHAAGHRGRCGAAQGAGFLPETVILSDNVGRFDVGRHALCRVHAERLVHKLDTFTELHRTAQDHIRRLIWWVYSDLKTSRVDPTSGQSRQLTGSPRLPVSSTPARPRQTPMQSILAARTFCPSYASMP